MSCYSGSFSIVLVRFKLTRSGWFILFQLAKDRLEFGSSGDILFCKKLFQFVCPRLM